MRSYFIPFHVLYFVCISFGDAILSLILSIFNRLWVDNHELQELDNSLQKCFGVDQMCFKCYLCIRCCPIVSMESIEISEKKHSCAYLLV